MRRSDSKHSRRLSDLIMRELADILAKEMADPRLSAVTISGVRLNARGNVAQALYTGPDEATLEQAASAFDHAKGFLRKRLAERLDMRATPELTFARDTFLEDMIYDHGSGPDTGRS